MQVILSIYALSFHCAEEQEDLKNRKRKERGERLWREEKDFGGRRRKASMRIGTNSSVPVPLYRSPISLAHRQIVYLAHSFVPNGRVSLWGGLASACFSLRGNENGQVQERHISHHVDRQKLPLSRGEERIIGRRGTAKAEFW